MSKIDLTNKFTIIGFGNQAKAWAMNLKDSGVEVFIGLREKSSSKEKAQSLGFTTFDFEKEKLPSQAFVLLTPDDTHTAILKTLSKENQGICLYAHGYSYVQGNHQKDFPMFEHVLLAPKCIASELRFNYETDNNLVGVYSLENQQSLDEESLKFFAKKLGLKSIYKASFLEETNADLFSEQSILCSMLPYGALKTYNTLREKGYPKELAFFECFYEIKLIADTLLKVGPLDFFNLISPNALIGSEKGKDLIFDENFQQKLNQLLEEIENKDFEKEVDQTDLNQLREKVSKYWSNEELSQTYDQLKDSI